MDKIRSILIEMGDSSSLIELMPVAGGDISQAYKAITGIGKYFIKLNATAPADFFWKEADNLKRLREAGAISVPQVYHVNPASASCRYIVMEWIETQPSPGAAQLLGQRLALLHQVKSTNYGLAENNYIGRLPQPNGWERSWLNFMREKRLGYQVKLAVKNGYAPIRRREMLENLLDRLDQWILDRGEPVLLHGDLWSGNWLTGPGGEPYLIDPAAFYGEREYELAFTQLFGGFPDTFYAAYQEINPLSDHYEEVRPLYQLYFLLVHLNLFGEAYGPAVDRILQRYVG